MGRRLQLVQVPFWSLLMRPLAPFALEDIAGGAPTWITVTQISGALSFIGSVYVLFTLIGNRERRSKNMPFNRLLLAISIADLMSSLAMMVAGWATPTTPPGNYEGYYSIERWEVYFPRAAGNIATCNAQGTID